MLTLYILLQNKLELREKSSLERFRRLLVVLDDRSKSLEQVMVEARVRWIPADGE